MIVHQKSGEAVEKEDKVKRWRKRGLPWTKGKALLEAKLVRCRFARFPYPSRIAFVAAAAQLPTIAHQHAWL